MAGTRSSARAVEKNNSSPPSATGTKRKADEQTSPSSTKSKRPTKEQKTLEETVQPSQKDQEDVVDEGFDEEMKDDEPKETKTSTNDDNQVDNMEKELEANKQAHSNGNKDISGGDAKQAQGNGNEDTNGGAEKNALDQVRASEEDEGKTSKPEEHKSVPDSADVEETAVEEDKKRKEAQPSNVLEKGIIYFFSRGRVGTDDPDSVQDLARSYFVLKPLPAGAKLTDGAIQDVGNNRLIALPKKVFPKSGKDRFMAFVEKEKATMETLKEDFFAGSEYSTKTTGTRQTPNVTPIGEGVYAFTRTGGGQGTTHLAYMLTIPSEIGEVQKDIGLADKGSFVLSVKNPESSAPSYALPNSAEYPKEIIEEFGGRGWMPAEPKHLDYVNSAFLLIGENFDDSNNLEPAAKDQKDDSKETPQEELEKLEGEDEQRVENLKGDDTVFVDLGISSKEYPKVMTTW